MPTSIPPEWLDDLEVGAKGSRKDAIELLMELLQVNPAHSAPREAVELLVDQLIAAATASAYLRIARPAIANQQTEDKNYE